MGEYKIIFLGTGSGRFVLSEQLRSTAGMLLKFNETLMILDPGPGTLLKLKKHNVDPKLISLVLVSHCHIDNSSDTNAVIDAMTTGGINKHGILLASKSVIEGFDDNYPILTKVHKSYLDKAVVMNPNDSFKFKNIEITALKTKHNDPTTIGFKIKTDKMTISFTADTDYFSGLINEHKDSDILIISNQRPFNSPKKGPLSSNDTANILNQIKPRLCILTQFGLNIIKSNPIYEAREIHKLTGVDVIAADDDMVIDLLNYQKSTKQGTLSNF